MKKFILEIIGFLFLLCVLLLGLYSINNPARLMKKVYQLEHQVEIFNLGTSHGNSFDYNYCRLNGVKFNRSGNTIYYDLQNYIYLNDMGVLDKEAVVLIPVSYFAFGLDENRSDRLPDDSFVNEFYHYLPSKMIKYFSHRKKMNLIIHRIQENFKLLVQSLIKGNITSFIKLSRPYVKEIRRKSYEKSLDISKLIDNEWLDEMESIRPLRKPKSAKKFEQHAKLRAAHHKQMATFGNKLMNSSYLEELIINIKKNGHYPILLTTPYYHKYNENMGVKWLKNNYFKLMRSISRTQKVPYLNFSHDARFTKDPKYFNNSDHLNRYGRKIFSIVCFSEIQDILNSTNQ